MTILGPVLIVIATVAAMEFVAYATHRWIMHGPLGWGWHKSHHEEHDHALEKNDLYGLVFAVIATVLFTVGWIWAPVLWWIALGMTVYGLIYFVLHDGLVHQRWPFRYIPRKGYARRLTDLGTIKNPAGLDSIGHTSALTAAMQRRNWPEARSERVMGENWIALLAEVWRG